MNLAQLLEKFPAKINTEKVGVGLDIGDASLKLVKLKFYKDKVELQFTLLENNLLDLEEALKKVIQSQQVRHFNISVCGPQAIIRYIDLPRMSPVELKQAIKFEAQKHIPFPISEVNVDGCILKDGLPNNRMKVLLAAVKKDLIDQRLKLLVPQGAALHIAEIDSISLINAFTFNYGDEPDVQNKTVALVNVGAIATNLNILENGLPALSRDIALGGNTITQRILEVTGVDFKTAEKVKLNKDPQYADKINIAMEQVLTKMAQEIRTSFDYHESRSVSSVEKIFLSGGASLNNGMDVMLSNLLGLPVVYWDPLKKIVLAHALDQTAVKAIAAQLPVAIGLALRQ